MFKKCEEKKYFAYFDTILLMAQATRDKTPSRRCPRSVIQKSLYFSAYFVLKTYWKGRLFCSTDIYKKHLMNKKNYLLFKYHNIYLKFNQSKTYENCLYFLILRHYRKINSFQTCGFLIMSIFRIFDRFIFSCRIQETRSPSSVAKLNIAPDRSSEM